MPATRLSFLPGVPAIAASAGGILLAFGFAVPASAAAQERTAGASPAQNASRPQSRREVPAGVVSCPIPRIHGVLGQGSPDWAGSTGLQTGRIVRDGDASSCELPKAFPGLGAMSGDRTYDSYAFVNANNVPACVSVTVTVDDASVCDTMVAAYLGEFDPDNVDQFYLADPGVSSGNPPAAIPSFSFEVGAGQAFLVVVHHLFGIAAAGCGYILDVSGLCPLPPYSCFTANAVYTSTNVPIPIADNTVTTSTIQVSGAGSRVFDVNVFTDIIHTFPADLDLTLESPSGRVVTLTTDNGGGNDNVFHGTLWDDQANTGGQVPYTTNAGLATDHPYVNGVVAPWLAPEEPLASLYATDPNGTWTLSMSDDSAQDQGALLGWSLQITTLPDLVGVFGWGSELAGPVPIPSGPAVVTSTVDFSNAPGTRLCSGVGVHTNITHTNASNLDVTLESPAGTVATLTSDNGGTNDDVFAGTNWSNFANPGGQVPYDFNDGLATDHSYADGVAVANLAPEESLAVFAGEDPRGIWTLTISDDTSGDSGTLNGWTLGLGLCSCATATPAAPVYADAHAVFGSVSNVNGVAEVGETFEFAPAWNNTAGIPIWLPASELTDFTGMAGPTYTIVQPFATYGPLAIGETVNCYDSSGQTFLLQITGARPAVSHFDAAATEATTLTSSPTTPEGGTPGSTTKLWRIHIGESFADVPTSHPFYRFIETILHNGVTGGCGGSSYCPDGQTRRDQMAVFVLKAEEGAAYVPPGCTGVFADVPCPGPFTDWIEELADRGVVAGCGGGNYCPDSPVLRQQMAVFLLKTHLGAGYAPPVCTGTFADVPCPSQFADWVEDLYNRGITGGCGSGNYCPTAVTTRGQMAVFLQKTFELLLYRP